MTIVGATGESPALGMYLGVDLCKALGLDGDKVHELTLRVSSTDVVTITVERYVTIDEGRDLVRILEKYNLHKIGEDG